MYAVKMLKKSMIDSELLINYVNFELTFGTSLCHPNVGNIEFFIDRDYEILFA